ncbi:XRE family transcriptional regulator [Amycolatopsis minnesotensis]|uniref:XRE family transcriptional regulator n=1 Tax=Amycolatopsis minnesotensis TaxID=337894 RepID=A0ABP5E5L9_9PSEU
MQREAHQLVETDPPRALAPALVHALRYGPFHRALAEAITQRGLPLSRLRARLNTQGVAIAESTLSYWQRGLRHPSVPRSLAAVRALEHVLRLPGDSLVVLIGPQQRAAEADERQPSIPELSQSWAETSALLDEFTDLSGHPCNAGLDVVTVLDTVRMTGRGNVYEVGSTMVVRARGHGPDSFVVTHQGEPEVDIEATELHAVEGCRIGRVRKRRSSAGMVFELLFDRRLGEGDVHVFSFRLTTANPVPSSTFFRTVRARMSVYLIHLHFDPTALPVRCTRVVRAREGLDPLLSEPLLCGRDGVVSAYFDTIGPGLAGVDFLWD